MNPRTILLTVATLIIAFGVYEYFFAAPSDQPPLSTVETASESVAQVQFQDLVSKLTPITFHTDIFSDPAFLSLVSLSTSVTPEAAGRLDPFATIPGMSGTP
jgi:hypothetical protein